MSIDLLAPAKINLALHVTGQRDDGYHLLDTLVTFANLGDRLSFAEADVLSFSLTGPAASDLPNNQENLVLKATKALSSWAAEKGIPVRGASITLNKHLPVSSGLGGGSADAAATLRGLIQLWELNIPASDLTALALSLGADVPMCLFGAPLHARGIGDEIEAVSMPQFHMVLVNPRVPVSTPEVFSKLETKSNPPLAALPNIETGDDWVHWLARQRNDLQKPSIELQVDIAHCLGALRHEHCLLSRMSGSGATCFGLFALEEQAQHAAQDIRDMHPDWWVAPCSTV